MEQWPGSRPSGWFPARRGEGLLGLTRAAAPRQCCLTYRKQIIAVKLQQAYDIFQNPNDDV